MRPAAALLSALLLSSAVLVGSAWAQAPPGACEGGDCAERCSTGELPNLPLVAGSAAAQAVKRPVGGPVPRGGAGPSPPLFLEPPPGYFLLDSVQREIWLPVGTPTPPWWTRSPPRSRS